jgi:hypothetical protein
MIGEFKSSRGTERLRQRATAGGLLLSPGCRTEEAPENN